MDATLPPHQYIQLSPLNPSPILYEATIGNNTPTVYATPPALLSIQPQSWIEMGLRGHATTFMLEVNGSQSLIVIQNERKRTQLVMEGMCISLEHLVNQMWSTNNLIPNLTTTMPGFLQIMQGLWNFTHFLNHFPNMKNITKTSFFTPHEAVSTIQFSSHGSLNQSRWTP
ncbi:hypothetical protein FXO37_03024 [Capsicum annuum]|nr:hypothetical protein FXO37_03024 [Capsicum annuum]